MTHVSPATVFPQFSGKFSGSKHQQQGGKAGTTQDPTHAIEPVEGMVHPREERRSDASHGDDWMTTGDKNHGDMYAIHWLDGG